MEVPRTVAPQPLSPPLPSPEVVAAAQRQAFTADYKQRILAAADIGTQASVLLLVSARTRA